VLEQLSAGDLALIQTAGHRAISTRAEPPDTWGGKPAPGRQDRRSHDSLLWWCSALFATLASRGGIKND